jgi:hypothetical protein
LVVQIALSVVVFWPQSTVSGAQAGPLLGDFKADDVVSVTIHDAEGNLVTLARQETDWVLPDADDYPANGEKISSMLDKVEGIQTNRQVTRTESSHKRLQVADDDFVRLVELKLAGGQTHKLYLGSSPQASATHVRADDRPETYLTADLPTYDVNATSASWIDTLYYTVPQTATVALTLKNTNGEFQFERAEGDQWTFQGLPENGVFNASTFTALLEQATSLRMLDPIGREEQDRFGLGDPQGVVTLKTQDGKTHTLRIGAKGEDNDNYAAKWSESPYYVWLAPYVADTFLQKTRDDFIQPPATPEPQAGSTPAPESPAGGD